MATWFAVAFAACALLLSAAGLAALTAWWLAQEAASWGLEPIGTPGEGRGVALRADLASEG